MSYNLFSGSDFSNARAWALLERIDEGEAAACRLAGCRHCGGVLHSATYPRKPHGLAPELRGGARRFSFCCATCRRRATPASVRFFGRRFRPAPLFVMVGALVSAPRARLGAIARRWAILVATPKRWQRWWRETLSATPTWRAWRGGLATPPDEPPVRWLLGRIRGRGLGARLLRSLIWLKPWSERISDRFFEVSFDTAFRRTVRRFLTHRRMSPREFELALGDRRLVNRLAEGRPVQLVTADTALEFMGEPPLGTLFHNEIEAYQEITGTKAYQLGLGSVGDRSFVTNLHNGLSPYLGTIDKVRGWMGRHSSAEERRAIGAATLHKSWFRQPVGGPIPTTEGYLTTKQAAKYLVLRQSDNAVC